MAGNVEVGTTENAAGRMPFQAKITGGATVHAVITVLEVAAVNWQHSR